MNSNLVAPDELNLFQAIGAMAGRALARQDRSTWQVYENWFARALRSCEPAHRRKLTQAYFEGMDRQANRLGGTVLQGEAPAEPVWDALERRTLVLRLVGTLHTAYSQLDTEEPTTKATAVQLKELGLQEYEFLELDQWAMRKGMDLVVERAPRLGGHALVYWPEALLLAATRIHTEQFGSQDLPTRWTAWALSQTIDASQWAQLG